MLMAATCTVCLSPVPKVTFGRFGVGKRCYAGHLEPSCKHNMHYNAMFIEVAGPDLIRPKKSSIL